MAEVDGYKLRLARGPHSARVNIDDRSVSYPESILERSGLFHPRPTCIDC